VNRNYAEFEASRRRIEPRIKTVCLLVKDVREIKQMLRTLVEARKSGGKGRKNYTPSPS
jgi:hypothetical protein